MPKVLITDKINKAAGEILSSVAQVDFIETLPEDELAKKIGYKSRSSINKIELDQNNLTQTKIKIIADARDEFW